VEVRVVVVVTGGEPEQKIQLRDVDTTIVRVAVLRRVVYLAGDTVTTAVRVWVVEEYTWTVDVLFIIAKSIVEETVV
jgi:hypothetical protein